MNSLIGDKADFAVEFSVDRASSIKGNLRGRVRLWVSGIGIGNFEEIDYLSHLQFKLKSLLENCGRRENVYLNNLDDEQLITFFKAQKKSIESYDEGIDIDKYYFGRVPAFDDFCILCLYTAGQIRFVWKLYEATNFAYPGYPKKALGGKIDLPAFEKIVTEFYQVGDVA
jgi:hypothetical protein